MELQGYEIKKGAHISFRAPEQKPHEWLIVADMHEPLVSRRANQKGNERIYTCSKYNKYGVKHCSQHRMKYDVLYSLGSVFGIFSISVKSKSLTMYSTGAVSTLTLT
jgi:hypothetical protein